MARKLTEPKLLLATHNQGKVREIAALVRPFGKTVVSAGELDLPEPEETETSFIGNASIKALAGAKASGLPALSDDSGLCVDALGGAPGVYTADWAERQPVEADALGGPGRDWYLAMGKVEGKLAQQGPLIDRSAAFKCALCLAWPDGHVEAFEGHVSGRLTWPPRGDRGFGYDPVFLPAGYDVTFGEMDPATKHGMSHRAHAFRQLVDACLMA